MLCEILSNPTENTGVEDNIKNTGVEDNIKNTGVEDNRNIDVHTDCDPVTPEPSNRDNIKNSDYKPDQRVNDDTGDDLDDTNNNDSKSEDDSIKSQTLEEKMQDAIEKGKLAATEDTELPTHKQRSNRNPAYKYVNMMFRNMDPKEVFTFLMGPDSELVTQFLTSQMTAKQELKHFGQPGETTIVKELEQLIYWKVMEGRHARALSREQKKAALRYLMFLEKKRCGRIKGCGCADGLKQRIYKTKEETSSPTITIESLFLTCLVDAMEKRCIATIDIPEAFMHADIDKQIHVKLDGDIAILLCKVDATYQQFLTYEGNKPVIYTELSKALYRTLKGALLFWRNLSNFLKSLGFKVNPYKWCVMNKDFEGKQCTIGWHVDDLKISHVDKKIVNLIISKLQETYGKQSPLTINRGKIHKYIGMKIDFTSSNKVIFSMEQYIDGLFG